MDQYSKLFLTAALILLTSTAFTQQLYFEGFTARQRSNFNLPAYQNPKAWYSPWGMRLAAGADKLQVGGEVRFNLQAPQWTILDEATQTQLGHHTFISSYYGALVRHKISRYPARRFGLHVIAGAGWTRMERQSSVVTEPASLQYDPTLTYNGSIGVSVPTGKSIMVEIGYSYFYVSFKEQEALPAMNGSFHSFHLGFSFNKVFGRRALAYDKIFNP